MKGLKSLGKARYLKCSNVQAQVIYERHTVHYRHDQAFLTQNPFYPGRAMMDSWLESVPKDSLRWAVTARPMAFTLRKAVLRSALQRKWYKLMCQALVQRGYRMDGRCIESGKPGLIGTLEVILQHVQIKTSDPESEVLQRCLRIVEAVEKEQRAPIHR
jgi:hypothetical protein